MGRLDERLERMECKIDKILDDNTKQWIAITTVKTKVAMPAIIIGLLATIVSVSIGALEIYQFFVPEAPERRVTLNIGPNEYKELGHINKWLVEPNLGGL